MRAQGKVTNPLAFATVLSKKYIVEFEIVAHCIQADDDFDLFQEFWRCSTVADACIRSNPTPLGARWEVTTPPRGLEVLPAVADAPIRSNPTDSRAGPHLSREIFSLICPIWLLQPTESHTDQGLKVKQAT